MCFCVRSGKQEENEIVLFGTWFQDSDLFLLEFTYDAMLTSFYARNIFPAQWCVRLSPWHESYEFLGTMKQVNPAHEISRSALSLATDKQETATCQTHTVNTSYTVCMQSHGITNYWGQESMPTSFSWCLWAMESAAVRTPWASSSHKTKKRVSHQRKAAAVCSLCAVDWVRSNHRNRFAFWSAESERSGISHCVCNGQSRGHMVKHCLSLLTRFQDDYGYIIECTQGFK